MHEGKVHETGDGRRVDEEEGPGRVIITTGARSYLLGQVGKQGKKGPRDDR